ncbi:MAG TPA: ATP-binding protein [Bryobacteraceae bacterium]|jgi:heavy metal sensor kinase|nr:ATP-binding protein [Bryobacteraceae bacterium]
MRIRERLTFWFASLFGVIVVALSITAYWVERSQAFARLDAGLMVTTGAMAMSARHELSEHITQADCEADLQAVLDEAKSADLSQTQILIEENGRTVAYKRASNAPDLRRVNLRNMAATETHGGLRIASYSLPVPRFHATYEIYAAAPVESTIAQINRARTVLLIVVPIGLLLAASVGNMLAGRALSPLGEFAETLEPIGSSDLSARVKIHNSRDAIGKLGLRFNALMERLEQLFRVQRLFMADASHQIRTPVTIALAAVQVTRRDSSATLADMRECLQTVERQMLRLRRIVDDMFFLSQADTTPLKIDRKEIYLDDAVAEATRAASTLAREKQQTLQQTGFPEAVCLGDLDLLTQAILILLDNAVKFTPKGGTISINICRAGESWVCSVTDNGPGIPPEDQSRIFERFFQGSGSEGGERKGAGLGLAIAKSIVESHGGSLTLVESGYGRTRFEIALPAVKIAIPAIPGRVKSRLDHANSSAVKM